MSGWFTTFMNCRLCRGGEIIEGDQLVVSDDTGDILHRTGYIGGDAVDLEDGIIAPGFLELQTNGMKGFHFTHFDDEKSYAAKVDEVARYLPSTGVTGFYPTIPTVSSEEFKKVRLQSMFMKLRFSRRRIDTTFIGPSDNRRWSVGLGSTC